MFFKRYMCVVLCLLLLIADSGQVLFAHTCLKAKHTSYSLSTSKGCCNNINATTGALSFRKASCCEVSSKYVKQSPSTQSGTAHVIKLTPHVFVVTQLFEPVPSIIPVSSHLSFLSASYPVSKDNIPFLQVFRC